MLRVLGRFYGLLALGLLALGAFALGGGSSLVGGSLNVGCKIKGNISQTGERIYHVPGQEYYSATRVSAGKGERWFCSEEEARQAAWRRARLSRAPSALQLAGRHASSE